MMKKGATQAVVVGSHSVLLGTPFDRSSVRRQPPLKFILTVIITCLHFPRKVVLGCSFSSFLIFVRVPS